MIEKKVIVILGAPRSGTTLLRVLLAQIPRSLSLPETPWITGVHGSLGTKKLYEELTQGRLGPVKNLPQTSIESVRSAMTSFILDVCIGNANEDRVKNIIIKTPDDSLELEYVREIFPSAYFIHITRDGRDVATSTVRNRTNLLSKKLVGYGINTLENSILRWYDIENEILKSFRNDRGRLHSIKYEELVLNPEVIIDKIYEYLNIVDPASYDYDVSNLVLPKWEQGSQDVLKHCKVNDAPIGRWKSFYTKQEHSRIPGKIIDYLEQQGYSISQNDIQTDYQVRKKYNYTKFCNLKLEISVRLMSLIRNCKRIITYSANSLRDALKSRRVAVVEFIE